MNARFLRASDMPIVRASVVDLAGVRLSVLDETNGDMQLVVPSNAIVMTRDGSRHHHARIDGRVMGEMSRPRDVAYLPRGVDLQSAWTNHGALQRFVMAELSEDLPRQVAPDVATPRVARGHLRPDGFAPRPVLAALLDTLAREAEPAQRRGRLFADSAIRLLMMELLADAWTIPVTGFDPAPADDPRVRRAIEFIAAHMAEDIGMAEIAAAAGLSPSALSVVFRKATGLSPYSWLIERRLDRATDLLVRSRLPLAEVAVTAGFFDQAHMTRSFRARRATTPGAIRQARST
jgi:AraC family transcriptional regulator